MNLLYSFFILISSILPSCFGQQNNDNIIYNSNFPFILSSVGIFSILIMTNVIFKNKFYFSKKIKIFNKYFSLGTIYFTFFYFTWWILALAYSLIDNNLMLQRLGYWNALNICFTILPITRNSIWIILFNIPYQNIIHIHIYLAILTLLSVVIKTIAVILQYNVDILWIYAVNGLSGSPLMGTLASLSILLTLILSIPKIRQYYFE